MPANSLSASHGCLTVWYQVSLAVLRPGHQSFMDTWNHVLQPVGRAYGQSVSRAYWQHVSRVYGQSVSRVYGQSVSRAYGLPGSGTAR